MRCFRVDEDSFTGIPLSTTQDGLCIEIGDKQLMLDSGLSQKLVSSRYTVVSRLKECLESGCYEGKHLSEAELESTAQLLERVERENISLLYADIEGEKNIVSEKARSPDALVLVEVQPGINGKLRFRSASFEEHIDTKSNRVKRRYKDAFPPPGVRIIESDTTREGVTHYLLRMMPCSSFRVERTGLLEMPRLERTRERVYAPRVLTISWMGKKGKAGSLPLMVFASRQQLE